METSAFIFFSLTFGIESSPQWPQACFQLSWRDECFDKCEFFVLSIYYKPERSILRHNLKITRNCTGSATRTQVLSERLYILNNLLS